MKKYIYIVLTSLFLISPSCTNLDEELYSTLTADQFYQTDQQLIQAMGNAYTTMQYRGTNLWGMFSANVVSTDEAVAPWRSNGGFLRNNNVHILSHQHGFSPTLPAVFGSWEFCYTTIAACNQIIYQIENSPAESESKPKYIAELKVLRAFAYYNAIDLFGNIPLSLDFADTSLPEQKSREEIFPIIEKEILDNLELLDAAPSSKNYGRCTQGVAYTILAKMYLNAEQWISEPRYEDAIDACNKIINSGNYHLENDYFSNFKIENQNSSETIFALPYDRRGGWGWQIHQYTLHAAFQPVYNISAPLWNGVNGMEAFYNLYDQEDKRIKSWLEGPQYDQNGVPLINVLGQPLNFTPHLNGLKNAGDDQGVRMAKWEFTRDLSQNESVDNDWTFFRYADVLLMKAEAIMRKNGGTASAEAVLLVNQVRERAYGNSNFNYTVATLTMAELLNERGRELAWEGHRRQDLIRFGKYQDAWFGKPADGGNYTNLMPLPADAMSSNPSLEQNPGY